MVGAARFELATPSPPDWCANRAALRSDEGAHYRERAFAAQYSCAAADLAPLARRIAAWALGVLMAARPSLLRLAPLVM